VPGDRLRGSLGAQERASRIIGAAPCKRR